MKANELFTGFPVGVSPENLAIAWWLALVGGLVVTLPTAVTGVLDWLEIRRGSAIWRTATAHLLAMLTATVVFLAAALAGHGGYVDHEVTGSALTLTLIGFVLLMLGGWFGRTVVFVHGMRVVKEEDIAACETIEPAAPADGAEREVRSVSALRATETQGGRGR